MSDPIDVPEPPQPPQPPAVADPVPVADPAPAAEPVPMAAQIPEQQEYRVTLLPNIGEDAPRHEVVLTGSVEQAHRIANLRNPGFTAQEGSIVLVSALPPQDEA